MRKFLKKFAACLIVAVMILSVRMMFSADVSAEASQTYTLNLVDLYRDSNWDYHYKTTTITCTIDQSIDLSQYVSTISGCTFHGWYTEEGGSGTAYSGTVSNLTSAGKTITLYAYWTKNKFYLTLDGNGSTSGSYSGKNIYGWTGENTLPINVYKKTGYVFAGWNTEKDGSGRSFSDGGTIWVTANNDGDDLTLYAQWRRPVYTIQFDGNGSTSGSMSSMTDLEYGEEYWLDKNTFGRKGYTFEGWNTMANGSGIDYDDEDLVSNLTSEDGAVITLYAIWSAGYYYIEFDGNGGTTSTLMGMFLVYGKSYTLEANAFKRTGYTFAGWNTKKNGSGKSYKNKASVKNLTAEIGDTITLYAQWTLNKYTIKFDGNGSTSGSMSAMTGCKYSSSYTLTANAFKKTGYTFAGWNTKKDGSGKSYKNKASVKKLTAKNTGTVTLYAQWTKNKAKKTTTTCSTCNGKKTITCKKCGGKGYPKCSTCNGEGATVVKGQGKVTCTTCNGSGLSTKKCTTCKGKKKVTCTTCNGTGTVK